MSEFFGEEPFEADEETVDVTGDELTQEIEELIGEGKSVKLVIDGDTSSPFVQEMIATIRKAGAIVVVPIEN